MESLQMVKYYFRYAIPISAIILLWEEIFSPSSYINQKMREFILGEGENAELLLQIVGGTTKGPQGKEYYDMLTLPTY